MLAAQCQFHHIINSQEVKIKLFYWQVTTVLAVYLKSSNTTHLKKSSLAFVSVARLSSRPVQEVP